MDEKLANYFDYAAATPMLPSAVNAMQPFYLDNFYNPSALYLDARENRHILDENRHKFAQTLGARPTEIIFTAGGTEANNLAINGILGQDPKAHIVTSAIEHESVLMPAKQFNHTIVGTDEKGLVDLTAMQKAITDDTRLVSVMYANNEIGTIQPIKQIVELVAKIRLERQQKAIKTPIYVHTDACQATNYLDMQISRLGVDLLTINSGKIYGPKQCGALYVRAGIVLKPIIMGGGQEWGLRSGTENLANICGFNVAWQNARQHYQSEAKRLSAIRDMFISTVTASNTSITINGALAKKRLANNIHLTVSGYDNERLLMELDERGFQVATGSACSASNGEPSHVLQAIGLSDDMARCSIRVTMGKYTTQQSALSLAKAFTKLVNK